MKPKNIRNHSVSQILTQVFTFRSRKTMSARQQAGGHKANLNNPNTSEESKQHSRDVLDGELGQGAQSQASSHEGKNPGNGKVPSMLSGTSDR